MSRRTSRPAVVTGDAMLEVVLAVAPAGDWPQPAGACHIAAVRTSCLPRTTDRHAAIGHCFFPTPRDRLSLRRRSFLLDELCFLTMRSRFGALFRSFRLCLFPSQLRAKIFFLDLVKIDRFQPALTCQVLELSRIHFP